MENRPVLIGFLALTAVIALGVLFLFQEDHEQSLPPEPPAGDGIDEPSIQPEEEPDAPPLTEGERVRIESRGDLAAGESALPLSFRKALGGYKGRVLEHDGTPVAGMTVRLLGVDYHDFIPDAALFFGEKPYRFTPKEAETATKEDGTFLIPGVFPLAFYALVADPDGPRTLARIVDIQVGPSEVVDLGDIVLDPHGVLLGRVIDEDGNPQPNVRVRAVDVPPIVFLSGIQDYREGGAFFVEQSFLGSVVIEPPPVFEKAFRMLPFPETVTNGEGTFRLEGVPFKPAMLVADRQGFSTTQHGPVSPSRDGEKNVGDVTLKSGWTLKGRLKDTSGKPVAGAEVRAGAVYTFKEFTVLQPSTRSGEDGTFTVSGLATLSVRVAVRRQSGETWINEGPVNPAEGVVEIELPATHDLKVVVKKEDGKPAVGARIRIRSLQGILGNLSFINPPGPPGKRMTRLEGEEGVFLFEQLSPGKYEILATAPGLAVQRKDALLGTADLELEMVLPAAHALRIRVMDKETGDPVEHALVYVSGDNDEIAFRPTMLNRTRSGKDGLALLEKVSPADEIRIVASHPAYAVTGVGIQAPFEEEYNIELIRGGTLEGVVYPGRTGPEPPYLLVLDYRGHTVSPEADTPRLKVTDLEGKFRLANLTPGRWQINVLRRFFDQEIAGLIELADANELHEEEALVASGETTYVELVIGLKKPAGTSSISGQVLLEGRPVMGARVSCGGASKAATDARGRYFLENVPAGVHRMELDKIPVADGKAEISLYRSIQVDDNITVYEDFHVLAGSVTGRVIDQHGGILPNGPFRLAFLMSDEDNPYGVRVHFETGKDGRFTCSSVPIGVYTLDCFDSKIECDSQKVKVRPGLRAGPVELVGQATVKVKGRVDLTGLEFDRPFGFLMVADSQETASGNVSGYKGVFFSTANGEFTTELVPGTYLVSLMGSGFSTKDMIQLTDLVVPLEGLSNVVLKKK